MIIVANSSSVVHSFFVVVQNKVQESRKQKGFSGEAQLEDSFLFLSSNVMLADHKLDPRIVLLLSSS